MTIGVKDVGMTADTKTIGEISTMLCRWGTIGERKRLKKDRRLKSDTAGSDILAGEASGLKIIRPS